MTIRVLQVGLGPIGAGVVRQLIERPGFEVTAAVDIDPQKAGRDVGEICGLEQAAGVVVETDLAAALARGGAEIAVVCTSSSLRAVLPQLEAILGARLPVVSTTEELSYPLFSQEALARRVDELARRAGVAVVGTGINPGFAMDTLPIVLTAACERVDSIVVDRVQDAARRRLPFQQKIGAGMEPGDFRARVAQGRLGHVGLTESIAMIAAALGWTLERVTDEIEPKVAAEPVASEAITVAPGQVAGIVQDGTGYRNGSPVIRLHMEAYLGAPESFDAVRIEGSPRLVSKVEGGLPGDVTTAAVTVNTLPRAVAAAAGLRTMRDLPIPSWWSGSGPVSRRRDS
jgi:4-hydroxy-tetrahydrodipicolinate reductase